MSLVHAANHLAAQGRGGDTHLVHMTSKELAAMQKLAESQGKSLTINPKTGLPEAGMLSTVLPMALGALAVATGQVEFLPLIAAGVGVADYAITGSLTQGLMAGLGTWSGGSLAGGLAEAGAASTANVAAQEGGNQAAQEFAKQQAAAEATRLTAQETAQQTASEIAKSQIGNMANLTTDQVANMTANLTDANAAEIVKSAGMANAGMGLPAASTAANMLSGISSPSAIGSTLMNNKMALAGVAAPLLSSSLTKQPTVASSAPQQKNPFGMKEIPRDENGKPIFYASIPSQPNPAYTPVYPDYVKNPYVSGAAGGGLMSGIPGYKGSPDYGSMVEGIGEVERGIEMATKRKPLEVPNPYVEIEPDEPELRRLDPHNRARKMLEMLSNSSRVKMAKGLPQSNVLGAINTDPAKVIAEQRAKEAIAAEQPTEAKEGGLMAAGGQAHLGDYSDGGHLLKGPGDGVSDSIPATIGGKQPARLATGEFVIPARIVSELGNGSTDAGAKRLYAMMDRIKAKRSKTKNIAADTKAYKYLPA
jgi:hypothetical protein